ncbi:hypothetical protein LOAG_17269 [Loa loa]|uniref:C2H2-type domain-containing protein n=1 Tax=Loa loa TaxID=7209 RepID=A0A1I7VTS2_LOALO|nr:hypothetical protein LOAG_17269 [Loa loa]EJD75627.1 hypothetical protein LOAG_17269 [Loa loa]
MDCSELWCLASVDGGECKETFDTYDEFEEHFCQKHLDLALFACGAKGCTAQFGTILQIFRHLAICKRRGKKIKLLQYSDSALESLTALDRAKLLAVQCCVKRAKRAGELAEIDGDITTKRSGKSNSAHCAHFSAQCSLDGMSFCSLLDDEQVHESVIEPPKIQVEDIEPEPNFSRKERAVTPARQAAWRLKEQMLLEEKMRKNNKPLEKIGGHTQKKQKKLPVKVTDKTRISALINDDPKKAKRISSHLQTMESGLSRDSALRTVNSKMPFESLKDIMYAKRRARLQREDNTQDRMSTIQKQPRVFESSLPAGPSNPPKMHDLSRTRSCSFELTVTRPPDYSEFLKNPVVNPTFHEIPLPLSLPPILPLQISPVQASNGHQNNFESDRLLTKTTLVSQPTTFSNSEIIQQKRGYMKPHGILRTKKHGFQNLVETVEQTGQIDFDILSLFSKRLKECKLEHLKVSTPQAEQFEQLTGKHSERTKSLKSNVRLEEEASSAELSKFKDNTDLNDLFCDKDSGRKEDDEYDETVPILLNLFSNKETATPVLFDPRIMPESPTPDSVYQLKKASPTQTSIENT